MDIQTHTSGAATVVVLSGKLDTVTAPAFEKRIREVIGTGAVRLVLDLSAIEYISSAGLRGLLVMSKLLKEKQGKACLVGVKGNVRSVFEMSGFLTFFRAEETVEAAVAALG
ncbi:MAG: STAS domain-containing protein [Verrucomicrobia bacterium]|nr:STAS domain-containing protein [Verrucomicrobiota bacterium]